MRSSSTGIRMGTRMIAGYAYEVFLDRNTDGDKDDSRICQVFLDRNTDGNKDDDVGKKLDERLLCFSK
jgi:hypothetical protein